MDLYLTHKFKLPWKQVGSLILSLNLNSLNQYITKKNLLY